ncbi:hypothetical protein LEMLEM_LOCUS17485, partial [Lemmus lemmus]
VRWHDSSQVRFLPPSDRGLRAPPLPAGGERCGAPSGSSNSNVDLQSFPAGTSKEARSPGHFQHRAELSTWRGGRGPHLRTPLKLAPGLDITRVTFILLNFSTGSNKN